MINAQWRVVGLLSFLLLLEAIKQPAVKAQLLNIRNVVSGNVSAAASGSSNTAQYTLPDAKIMLYWGFGAAALVLLAAAAPEAATWLAIILVVLVLLSDVGLYLPYLKMPAAQPSQQKA